MRADAKRNIELILKAALAVFTDSGVDAPIREIAEKAGVGIGTLYRHFPQRSDLIGAIIRHEVDHCVKDATQLATTLEPGPALAAWMQRLVDLSIAKRGLAAALHSGDPAYQSLPDYVLGELTPALQKLLKAAVKAKVARKDIDPAELVLAGLRLAAPAGEGDVPQARRMVALLVAGLRPD